MTVVCVLGDIAAGEPGRVRSIAGPVQRRVFAALVARRNETLQMSALVDACWPNEPAPEHSEHNMRSYVHRVRRAIGDDGELIETVANGYRLTTTVGQVDADEFARLARHASRALAVGDGAATVEAAERALALWHGPPYAELGDERWAVPEAAHLDELRVSVRTDRSEALLELGKPAAAAAELEQLVREDPLRERPRALLMRALYDSGRQAEALREFQNYRRLLIEEAGVEPSSGLVELDRRIACGGSTSPPRTVRGYDMHERIGVGAFAVVHRATQRALGRDVAIKIVRAELADNPAFIRRFEAEAQMVASIEHPNVVPLYDYWREPGQAFIVMRWMVGGSLETRLDDGPWAVEPTAELIDQIADALDAAHAREIVHRDIKPANILFDDAGRALLGDFGIALASDERATPAAALSAGSPIFAAPEQLRREPVGPEADVHALAILAYSLLAGRTPFADAADEPSALRHQLHDPVPPVSRFRPGLPVALDEVLAVATAKAPSDRYATATGFARAFRAAALGGVVRNPPQPSAPTPRNPYVGLQAFGETDAAVFYGRTRLVRELLEHLNQPDQRLLVLVGPSGSGKSSVVRAGLLPAIRSGTLPGSDLWFTTSMTPGHQPYEALETALLRVAADPPPTLADLLRDGDRGIVRACKRIPPGGEGTIALVIDQFEELFTSTAHQERDRFLRALAVAVEEPGGPVRVIITLRADFFDAPLSHPRFAPFVKARSVAITPLAADELEEAITRPAETVGIRFEPGLVAEILADVNSQPGALPLLQYSLMQLYDAAEHATITIADYRRIGGIAGALAHRAETLYDGADDAERAALRHLLERLVHVGDGPDDTRRRIRRSELPSEPAVERVITQFGSARLLTFDRDPSTREPTVEVAHEALIRAWPRLREWLDDDRDLLRAHRHLTSAAGTWSDRGRDPSELYRGARLEQAERLLAEGRVALNEGERRFLSESCAAREAETRRERDRLRRLRRLTIASACAAMLALVAGVAAAGQWRRADRQADRATLAAVEAEARAVESTAQRLAVQALEALEQDPDLAILLALESVARTAEAGLPTGDRAIEALHTVTQSSRLLARFPTQGGSAIDSSGSRIALVQLTEGRREVVLVDTSTRAVVARTPVDEPVDVMAFVDDAPRLFVATQEMVILLDEDLTRLAAAPVNCCAFAIAADPDGRFIATGHARDPAPFTVVWDTSGLGRVREVEGAPGGWAGGELLVANDGAVQRIDVGTGETQVVETPGRVREVDVHPEGAEIMMTTDTGRLVIAPFDGNTIGDTTDLGVDIGVQFQRGGFTSDGRRAFAAGPSDEVRLVTASAESNLPELSLRGHSANRSASTDASGNLMVASGPGEALLWDLSLSGPSELGAIPVEGQVWRAEFSDDGATMYVADQPDESDRMRAVQMADGAVLGAAEGFGRLVNTAVSPVATSSGIVAGFVGGGRDGRVVDLDTGRVLNELDPCHVPTSIDADGRWMLVTPAFATSDCGGSRSAILDPMSGEVLLTLPEGAGGSDIGPPRTISDGIAVYQRLDGEVGLVFRDLASGKRLASFDIPAWMPAFSADGRYVTVGSAESGGFAIDVESVLAGDAESSIALNPVVDGSLTSFPVIANDRLITGHAGGVLRFWRLSDGVQELVLPGTSSDTTYIFPTPDGRYLYYESDGHLLRRFPLLIDDLVDLAERRAQRWFRVSECERYELADDCADFVATGGSTSST